MLRVDDLIREIAKRFAVARLFYGHGTDNPRDEAAALVFHVLGLDHGDVPKAYAAAVSARHAKRIDGLARLRVSQRKPLAYLLGEAWFAGLPFHVSPAVLIPRSPFAELIADQFGPWLRPANVRRILEIGTGSGCIAVACARAFPRAEVLATDISAAALRMARRNVRRHGLDHRIALLRSDLYERVSGTFDLIVSNPPYVPQREIPRFPAEYRHEPVLALASGMDGMEYPARILHHAAAYLAPRGWLALEVGAGAARLQSRFPGLPMIWPEFQHGGDGIALVARADLAALPAPRAARTLKAAQRITRQKS
jgi:ribosomal protein L3 glutamine methyltransferase